MAEPDLIMGSKEARFIESTFMDIAVGLMVVLLVFVYAAVFKGWGSALEVIVIGVGLFWSSLFFIDPPDSVVKFLVRKIYHR